ncbi:unnamed protein product [Arctia plantaginis]|uniref:Uncharacterized protein n=1 Tax=Arctia plantaginis TaxID=874455 RepID=A0A8S1B3E1_ARCPL|nr:unnamed protein product [Arctia plantaginis]
MKLTQLRSAAHPAAARTPMCPLGRTSATKRYRSPAPPAASTRTNVRARPHQRHQVAVARNRRPARNQYKHLCQLPLTSASRGKHTHQRVRSDAPAPPSGDHAKS